VLGLPSRIQKRRSFTRRRAFDSEADIDYINSANMRFNERLDRFYSTYTKSLKDDIERGTAL
jgi:pre-mRNA-splicing factor SYF2